MCVAVRRLVPELDRLAVRDVTEDLAEVVEWAACGRCARIAEGVGRDQGDRPEIDPERRVERGREPPRDLDRLGRGDVAVAQGDQVGVAGDRAQKRRLEADRVAHVHRLGHARGGHVHGGQGHGRHFGRPRLGPPHRAISRWGAGGAGLRSRPGLGLSGRRTVAAGNDGAAGGTAGSRATRARVISIRMDTHPASEAKRYGAGSSRPRDHRTAEPGPPSSTTTVEGSSPQVSCFVSCEQRSTVDCCLWTGLEIIYQTAQASSAADCYLIEIECHSTWLRNRTVQGIDHDPSLGDVAVGTASRARRLSER